MTDMDMPLPEPLDYCYEWDGPYGSRKFSAALHNGLPPDRSVAIYSADQLRARDAQWRAIVAAEVAKERERMMPLIDEAILDAAGAALAGAGYDGDAIEKIAPRVLEMWRGFKSAAAIRAAAPPQCTAPPSEPQ